MKTHEEKIAAIGAVIKKDPVNFWNKPDLIVEAVAHSAAATSHRAAGLIHQALESPGLVSLLDNSYRTLALGVWIAECFNSDYFMDRISKIRASEEAQPATAD